MNYIMIKKNQRAVVLRTGKRKKRTGLWGYKPVLFANPKLGDSTPTARMLSLWSEVGRKLRFIFSCGFLL